MTLPDGYYAVPDPDNETVMTRWRIAEHDCEDIR